MVGESEISRPGLGSPALRLDGIVLRREDLSGRAGISDLKWKGDKLIDMGAQIILCDPIWIFIFADSLI